jgi:hypothetical protein
MSDQFFETPTPNCRWSEAVVEQTFRCIVNHDGLATRHKVRLGYDWCQLDYGYVVGGVKVWLNFGTPEQVLLYTVERKPDRNTKVDLIDGFKDVRKLLLLL